MPTLSLQGCIYSVSKNMMQKVYKNNTLHISQYYSDYISIYATLSVHYACTKRINLTRFDYV